MRSINPLLLGALIAAAPVLVTSEALAIVEPEPCGSEDIPGDADCEILTGGDCGGMCDACDMTEQCQDSCSSDCAGEANEVACIAFCLPQCAAGLAVGCAGGCGAAGSLFCNGKYVEVDDIDICVDHLCSIGMNVGDACEPEPTCVADPCPVDASSGPARLLGPTSAAGAPGYDEPSPAPTMEVARCAASDGISDGSEGGLFVAVIGAGLFMVRRRRG